MSTHGRPSAGSRQSTVEEQPKTSDRAIDLIDSTKPTETTQDTRSRSESPGWRKLARNVSKSSVKGSIKRRKYAKWSQERIEANSRDQSVRDIPDEEEDAEAGSSIRPTVTTHESSEVVDFAQPDAQVDESRRERKRVKKQKKSQDFAIDILYENQRGSFFCGIPLYSSSSLLQFDPAPWVTKEFRESAVNITNAQVPDPSWQWDWKHWYVDMSGDVDEDGWQYSFAFFGNSAWHGTHPWFHSYVRRRRWLRRRVKKAKFSSGAPMPSSMSAAHRLNADYFTIHSKSIGKTFDETSQVNGPESYMSRRSTVAMGEDIPEDVNDIASLLKSMRLSSIDREKIDSIKHFVDAGGEELYYLREHISEIMSQLVYQNSKRKLLEILKSKADEAQQHRDEHIAQSRPESEAEQRRIDNLLSAAEVADEQIGGLEYWSDRKHVLLTREDSMSPQAIKLTTIFDEPVSSPKLEPIAADQMKGIPDKAEIGQDPTRQVVSDIRGTQHVEERRDEETHQDKGKSKALEEEEDADLKDVPTRLGQDQIFIPDEAA